MRRFVLCFVLPFCVSTANSASQIEQTVSKGTPPTVTSIAVLTAPSPESLTIEFQVIFSEFVSNVSEDDFSLTTTGTVDATVDLVFEDLDAATYLAYVSIIDGFGTVRLDLNGGTDIIDGGGATPPAFNSGEVAQVALASPLTFSFNGTTRDTRQRQTMTELGGASTYGLNSISGSERSVRLFPAGGGLALEPGNAVVSNDAYTLFMRVRLDDQTGYRKLVDFEGGSSDNGLYFFNGSLHFFPISDPGAGSVSGSEWADVAVTRNDTGEVKTFLNGVEQETGMDPGNLSTLPGTALRLLVDDTVTTTEESAGALACVQVRDGAMSPAEVSMLDCPFRIGLNDDGCAYDRLNQALAVADADDRILLTEQDEYLGRWAFDRRVYMEGSLLNEDCIIGTFGAIDPPQLTNPDPVTGRGGVLELTNGADVSLVNLQIVDGQAGEGGGIYAGPGTQLTLNSVFLDGNKALTSLTDANTGAAGAAGGCIFADQATIRTQFFVAENCSVEDDAQLVAGDGGGMFVTNGSEVELGSATFLGNSARSGGGVFAEASAIDIVGGTGFESNSAAESGGGMVLQGGSLTVSPSPFFFGFIPTEPIALFLNNSAFTGGGLTILGEPGASTVELGNAQFVGNTADFGGGLFVRDRTVSVIDNAFVGNVGHEGGAIRTQMATVSVRASDACRSYRYLDPVMFFGLQRYCSRFEANNAPFGSAMSAVVGSNITISRTAVVDNGASESAIDLFDVTNRLSMDNVWLGRNMSAAIKADSASEIDGFNVTIEGNANAAVLLSDQANAFFNASILYGNGAGIVNSGTGLIGWFGSETGCNIDQTGLIGQNVDPLLGTTERGDAHLLPGSPAIDLCVGESVLPPRYTDLDAVPRVQGAREDAGAFESGPFLFGDGLE